MGIRRATIHLGGWGPRIFTVICYQVLYFKYVKYFKDVRGCWRKSKEIPTFLGISHEVDNAVGKDGQQVDHALQTLNNAYETLRTFVCAVKARRWNA